MFITYIFTIKKIEKKIFLTILVALLVTVLPVK